MIIISDPSKGATTLVFSSEEDLKNHIENLDKLRLHKQVPGNSYPATYTVWPEALPTSPDVRIHGEKCKKMLL